MVSFSTIRSVTMADRLWLKSFDQFMVAKKIVFLAKNKELAEK